MRLHFLVGLAMALILTMPAQASECGMSCCVGSGIEAAGDHDGLSVTTQYERMNMKTILEGTQQVSPESVVTEALANGNRRFSAPTRMLMQRYTLNFSQRLAPEDALVLSVPYVVNDMDMLMGRRPMMPGMPPMLETMKMDTVSGLGDVSLTWIHDVHREAPGDRVSLGLGVKMPTGASQIRNARGTLVHAMMQPGTGSWDVLLVANGSVGLGQLDDGGAEFYIQPSATYQLTTPNELGYRQGNRLDLDSSFRWRTSSEFNLKLDLHGIFRGQDQTDGTRDPQTGLVAYQNPEASMIDNVQNTGITSLFLAPGFQWQPSADVVVSGEYRIPLAQNARGIQQVIDDWQFLRVSVRL